MLTPPHSKSPDNIVIALIRSQSTAGALNDMMKARSNIHVIETDIYDSSKLKATVHEVAHMTGNRLDVLIHNAYSAGTDAIMWNPTQLYVLAIDLNEDVAELLLQRGKGG
jgi:NADP-dependent 3-hydroxy acid dehydrogenase YdfG